jgi:hypothetical protein
LKTAGRLVLAHLPEQVADAAFLAADTLGLAREVPQGRQPRAGVHNFPVVSPLHGLAQLQELLGGGDGLGQPVLLLKLVDAPAQGPSAAGVFPLQQPLSRRLRRVRCYGQGLVRGGKAQAGKEPGEGRAGQENSRREYHGDPPLFPWRERYAQA